MSMITRKLKLRYLWILSLGLTLLTANVSAQSSSPAGGNWLVLDHYRDYATAPDTPSLDVGDDEDFTIETWIYLPSSYPSYPKYVLKGGNFMLKIDKYTSDYIN